MYFSALSLHHVSETKDKTNLFFHLLSENKKLFSETSIVEIKIVVLEKK